MTPLDRFISRVRVLRSDCWEWVGSLDDGYGSFYIDGRKRKAHIAGYLLFGGVIPEGLVLDHLCRKRDCVNPIHLEPVTQQENVLRGNGVAAMNAQKTHCPKGHAYTAENLHIYKGMRYCRACHKTQSLNWVQKKRHEKAAAN